MTLLFSVLLPTALLVWGLVWWQDRPIRAISEMLEQKDYFAALQAADEYTVMYPADLRGQMLKARILSGLGRYAAADYLFEQLAISSNGFPDDSAALRAWSECLLHMSRWSRAIPILQTLAEDNPSDPEVLYRLSVARIRLRQYDAALKSVHQLARIPGQEEQANVMIGTIHHDHGNRRAALDAWEAVLKSNPNAQNLQISAGEFFAMVGGELLELGYSDRAAAMLERSLASRPNARSYTLLGKAYSQMFKQDVAVQAWKSAMQLEEGNAEAREELANIALRRGAAQEAVDLLLPLNSTGELKSSSAYLLQRAYTLLNRPNEAEQWRDRAQALREAETARNSVNEMLRNSTDPFWSSFLYAYQLAEHDEWDKAAEIIEGLLRERPNEPLLIPLADAVKRRGELPTLGNSHDKRYE